MQERREDRNAIGTIRLRSGLVFVGLSQYSVV